MRRVAAIALVAMLAAGCGHTQFAPAQPPLTLSAPTPAGMEELPPQAFTTPPLQDNCNRTASLRPFPDKAQADAAVAGIRSRGRLVVGLDIGSNLFSFR